jgi:hypothetical protein
MSKISDEQIASALANYYTPPEDVTSAINQTQLVDLLKQLPGLSFQDQADTLANQLRDHFPGTTLNKDNFCTISFIDDTFTRLLAQTDLDYRVESMIRCLSPLIAVEILENGPLVNLKKNLNVQLIDMFMDEFIGWSEDLGVLGEQFMEKIEEPMLSLVKDRVSTVDCLKELKAHFQKEHQQYKKLEAVLADKELANLAEVQAKLLGARMLNDAMSGQKIPMFTIFFLQGAWLEFLREIVVHYGEESKEFSNAGKLTKAFIWSLQDQDDKAKQQKIMNTLPKNIIEFSQKLKFDTSTIEMSVGDIQEEYDQINKGNPSEPCEFDLIELGENTDDKGLVMEDSRRKELESITTNDWFLFDDKRDSDEKVARLKVIVNSAQTGRMLLTNQNRRKAMKLNYGQVASYLADATIKPLSAKYDTCKLIGVHLSEVLQTVSDQNRKKKQLDDVEDQVKVTEEYIEDRKASQAENQQKQKQIIARKKKRSMALRRKAKQKLKMAQEAVEQLKPNAWVKLPLMVGTLTPAKLVAIIPGNEKYIFANRAGIKVAEYTASQLSNMLITENSEILDTGDEFEQVLSDVVIGLRLDKNKSFEELTGDVA